MWSLVFVVSSGNMVLECTGPSAAGGLVSVYPYLFIYIAIRLSVSTNYCTFKFVTTVHTNDDVSGLSKLVGLPEAFD